ncbi:MAG: deoxyribonuclease IV [Chloroflexi bacterium]|nr:deoxyribonuclease IV [Chloroflexota bacterium]
MRVGAHVSAAGGLDKAADRAVELGAETIQVFVSPPQGWAFKPPSEDVVAAFKAKLRGADIGPVFIHAIYLVNLGSPSPENLAKSVDSLTKAMNTAALIGARGVIFHAGSHKGRGFEGVLDQVVKAIREVLAGCAPGPSLLIENSAGMGEHIGASFEQLARLLEAAGSPRVKICLDTQHAYAAGYDVAHPEGLNKAMGEFNRLIGLGYLVAVHANDSKRALGDGVDRHDNIGEGHIGYEGFQTIMAHPAFRDVPFLLEVPGTEGSGPDRPNVERLKEIRAKVGVSK